MIFYTLISLFLSPFVFIWFCLKFLTRVSFMLSVLTISIAVWGLALAYIGPMVLRFFVWLWRLIRQRYASEFHRLFSSVPVNVEVPVHADGYVALPPIIHPPDVVEDVMMDALAPELNDQEELENLPA